MSALNCYEISLAFGETRLGRVISGDQRCEIGYPHGSLTMFFTEERVKTLVSCTCKRCPALCESQVDALVPTIRNTGNSYVGVLSFLLLHSKWQFIFGFIDKGYSDQKLYTLDEVDLPAIHEQEFNQMLSLKADDKSTEYVNFFRFFMPVPQYVDRSIAAPRRIHRLQILPFDIISSVGGGGYATIFATEILPRYHEFDSVKDGRVALKIFTNMNDGNLVRENNVRYSHTRVMPLQAAIVHKRTYMHMFPLAKKNLNELFDHDPPTGKDYTPKDEIARHRWNEFTVLLGALNYIHTDRPSEADFHIDLKDGDDKYSPPETDVSRSYDVWATGCIGCELLMCLKDRSADVMQFHNDRKHTKSRKIKAVVYNLHCGKDVDDLQPATKNVLAKAQSESGLSNEVAKMVEEIRVLSPLNVPENFEGKNHKPPPAEGLQSRDLSQLDCSQLHLGFHDRVLSPTPGVLSTKSAFSIAEILLLYGRNPDINTKENDIWCTPEVPSCHGRKGTSSEMLLGLCSGFGLLILPAYRRYRKDCHMGLAIQNKSGTWMHLALVLSFSFGHYSSLIGMGCKLLGKANKRESRRLKNGAVALMVPIVVLLAGLLGYGVDSEVLMVAVLPQCLSLWVSLVWLWTGRCNEKCNDCCAVDQKA